MQIFYSDTFVIELPAGHRFPMAKYSQLRRRVLAAGLVDRANIRIPAAATFAQLRLVHEPAYVDRVRDGQLSAAEMRRIGFPWSTSLVERSRRSVGGTIAAARAALDDGLAANLAGGTHHAHADFGQGFCVFNDTAVAARVLQQAGAAKQVLIVDADVHQGNGTAAIFQGDDTVFTFSIHGARNFPFQKVPGDLDVALPDDSGDDAFLPAFAAALDQAFARSRPDFVFYLAGADPYAGDALGRLSLSKAGLAERDRLVFARLDQTGTPAAIVMGGGYARDVEDIVDIHFQTIQLAVANWARRQAPQDSTTTA